jgi:hypothetical protein
MDDTSIIVTNSSPADFTSHINTVFEQRNRWLKVNLLSLNSVKTYYIQFIIKNSSNIDMYMITNLTDTKFLGIFI